MIYDTYMEVKMKLTERFSGGACSIHHREIPWWSLQHTPQKDSLVELAATTSNL